VCVCVCVCPWPWLKAQAQAQATLCVCPSVLPRAMEACGADDDEMCGQESAAVMFRTPSCRFGERCWRPACVFAHPQRVRRLEDLAAFWASAVRVAMGHLEVDAELGAKERHAKEEAERQDAAKEEARANLVAARKARKAEEKEAKAEAAARAKAEAEAHAAAEASALAKAKAKAVADAKAKAAEEAKLAAEAAKVAAEAEAQAAAAARAQEAANGQAKRARKEAARKAKDEEEARAKAAAVAHAAAAAKAKALAKAKDKAEAEVEAKREAEARDSATAGSEVDAGSLKAPPGLASSAEWEKALEQASEQPAAGAGASTGDAARWRACRKVLDALGAEVEGEDGTSASLRAWACCELEAAEAVLFGEGAVEHAKPFADAKDDERL